MAIGDDVRLTVEILVPFSQLDKVKGRGSAMVSVQSVNVGLLYGEVTGGIVCRFEISKLRLEPSSTFPELLQTMGRFQFRSMGLSRHPRYVLWHVQYMWDLSINHATPSLIVFLLQTAQQLFRSLLSRRSSSLSPPPASPRQRYLSKPFSQFSSLSPFPASSLNPWAAEFELPLLDSASLKWTIYRLHTIISLN